ncbi:MAG: Protease 3 precursor [bacterium ADurb.Bin212]|nr:MAG: Protease 3 precursor [bacterium ADurb.Bin212]
MEYQKHTLKNGLRIIIVPRKDTEAVAVYLGVGVGSRYEKEHTAGISHFAEHMCFKGSKKRPSALEVSEFIEDIGGIVNAYTSKEHTSYYVKIASTHLERAFDYLADNLINPLNDPVEFERERGVIIEDLKMHKDRPMEEVAELFEEALFTETNLARRIGGSVESVSNITLKDLNAFESDYYFSENCVLAVVGDLNGMSESQIVSMAERYFCFDKGDKSKAKHSGTSDQFKIISDARPIEQTNIIIGFGGPSLLAEDRYAAKVMAMVLGGGMSSRMFTEVREKRGLAYAIFSSCQGYSDTGMIYTQAGIANNNLSESIETIINEYKKMVESKITEQELSRAKEMIKGGLLISLEDSDEIADMLVSMELDQGRILNIKDVIARVEAVSVNDVSKITNKYFDFKKMLVSVVGPHVTEQKIASIIEKINI